MPSLKSLGIIFAFAMLGFSAQAQSSNFSSHSPIVLYHFVRGTAHLSQHADALDQQNGSGETLRDAFGSTVGLTRPDREAFFQFALTAEAQFSALDQQAQEIIANARAQRTADGLIPPPPAELGTLQQQKLALMHKLAASLAESAVSEPGKIAFAAYLSRAAGKTSAVNPTNGQ
jgi:hypothetical protein